RRPGAARAAGARGGGARPGVDHARGEHALRRRPPERARPRPGGPGRRGRAPGGGGGEAAAELVPHLGRRVREPAARHGAPRGHHPGVDRVTLAILFRTFGSLRCALLILATIPFALVGGVVGLDVAGLNLSVSACIGFIALMGQVVLNGVVLVSQINALRAEGLGLRAAVEAGATRRLRAVLMTALLAALGLLPAALSTQIGSETQRPLAVVLIGGLVAA